MAVDPNPNPTSEDLALGGGKPSPGSADSPGDSSDGKTLNELAEAKARTLMQGTMDRNRELMTTGRYKEMDPKILELLTDYEKTVQVTRKSAEPATAAPANPYADVLVPGAKPAEPAVPSVLEQKGMEAQRAEVVAKLEEQVADRWVKAAWRKDADAFFRDMKDVKNFEEDDFPLVDITNSQEFPLNGDGYRKWLNNATRVRVKYLNDGGEPRTKESGDGGSPDPTAVDRARAKRTKRQPGANSSAAAATSLSDAAKQRHEGKMSDADFREQIKSRIPRGGRVVA